MRRALIRLRDAVTTVVIVAWQAVASLRYNWGIGLLSVALAISLWVFVTDQENPERTGRVPSSVPIEVVNVFDSGQAVVSLSPSSVEVRARAPENIFDELTSDDFRATVDLSAVTGQEAVVVVQVVPDDSRVDVVDVSPAQVTVLLENVTSQAVPVRTRLVGTPPRGFEAREITVQPTVVAVTGPESLVARVQAVVADVNLTGVNTTFDQVLLLEPRDEQGGNIQGVTVDPESARVQVAIAQLEFSAVFVVLPEVTGTPAAGFFVTAMEVDPPFVVISGPADVFQTLNPSEGVATQAVSIDGARADVVRTVALRLPPGATASQPGVTIRIVIEPVAGAAATPTQ
ncbi:MAG: hypothetical protein IH959_03165 [Chloroflexi bacterium]|nr:hypothetical protein [Chloroflexota bacterium]